MPDNGRGVVGCAPNFLLFMMYVLVFFGARGVRALVADDFDFDLGVRFTTPLGVDVERAGVAGVCACVFRFGFVPPATLVAPASVAVRCDAGTLRFLFGAADADFLVFLVSFDGRCFPIVVAFVVRGVRIMSWIHVFFRMTKQMLDSHVDAYALDGARMRALVVYSVDITCLGVCGCWRRSPEAKATIGESDQEALVARCGGESGDADVGDIDLRSNG